MMTKKKIQMTTQNSLGDLPGVTKCRFSAIEDLPGNRIIENFYDSSVITATFKKISFTVYTENKV